MLRLGKRSTRAHSAGRRGRASDSAGTDMHRNRRTWPCAISAELSCPLLHRCAHEAAYSDRLLYKLQLLTFRCEATLAFQMNKGGVT